jgi:hypothetical protein
MKKCFVFLLLLFLGIMTWCVIGCGSGGSNTPPDENPIQPIQIPDDGEIPDPPRNISGLGGNGLAILSWEPPFAPAGYRVYQSENGVTFIRLTSTAKITGTQALISGLTNGKSYYFGVSTLDERSNESRIAYIGGSPTAAKIIPRRPEGPYAPPAPKNLAYVPGDRKLMVTWEQDEINMINNFVFKRSMYIDPLANIVGKKKETKRLQYMAAFDLRMELPLTFNEYPVGSFISGFTIPATPYWIDHGEGYFGLPPNYLPVGLVDGDINFNYQIGAWVSEGYSNFASLPNCTPLDLPPDPPVLLAALLTGNAAGDGVGILLEWTQPRPPENSDIRNYVLRRVQTDNLVSISLIMDYPFNIAETSQTYQDDTVLPGKTYIYQVFSQDYMAQPSYGSNSIPISIPGGEEPPPA